MVMVITISKAKDGEPIDIINSDFSNGKVNRLAAQTVHYGIGGEF